MLTNNVDNTQINHLEWCAGYGGLHLGLRRVVPNLRLIAASEIEAYACANLVAKMEAGLMDAAPIWTNLKTFPCEQFRGLVDIFTAGYPCQPFSAAGKRRGHDDPRHLWPFIQRAVGIIRPGCCFFENVEGHLTLGFKDVCHDLDELGYVVAAGLFSAAEIGASHQRKRLFIMAHRSGYRLDIDGELHRWQSQYGEQAPRRGDVDGRDTALANGSDGRLGELRQSSGGHGQPDGRDEAMGDAEVNTGNGKTQPHQRQNLPKTRRAGRDLAHAIDGGSQERRAESVGAIRHRGDEGERPAAEKSGGESVDNPTITGLEARDELASEQESRLTLRRGESMADASERQLQEPWRRTEGRDGTGSASAQGMEHASRPSGARQSEQHESVSRQTGFKFPPRPEDRDGWRRVLEIDPRLEPALCRVAHGITHRVDRLRLCGNGVVPDTAAKAFVTLWKEITRADL